MKFGELALGKKPSAMSSDEDGEEKPSGDFGGAGLGMAVRAFAKALGIDADLIDMPKAVKAFKAASVACKAGSDDAELGGEEDVE